MVKHTPNALFLYSLKPSENHKVFWCFQGLKKKCIKYKWVKLIFIVFLEEKQNFIEKFIDGTKTAREW